MTSSHHLHIHRPKAPWLIFLALAFTGALWLSAPSPATAAITATRIDSPATTTFQLDDQELAPPSITVAGATNSTDPAHDAVDVYCAGETGWQALAEGVPLAGDGSFSVDVSTHPLRGVCRLRAFPAGGIPGDEAPFAGPLISVGGVSRTRIGGGPNDGKLSDFFLVDPQLTAGNSFASAGNCGLQAGFLLNANAVSTQTFGCSDWFWVTTDLQGKAPSPTPRSELQVDGMNAYLPNGAKLINKEATGLPEVSFSYSHDPATGDLTLTDSEPLVECSTQAFPPLECPSFVPSGVVLDRTIEQTDDGHLTTITDSFSSSDGEAHQIDLLSQQAANFNRTAPRPHPIGYRFPGESGYSTHRIGDVVNFAADAPGTIYFRQQEDPDGNPASGRGAIVFDRPASPATFNYEDSYATAFYLHQTGTVPAAGATSFRLAYAQAYTQADVEALAAEARTAFGGAPPAGSGQPPSEPASPADPGQSPATPASPSTPKQKGKAHAAPSNRIRVVRIWLDRRHGRAKLKLVLPGPGRVTLRGHQLHTVRLRVHAAGPKVVVVRPKPALAATLRRRGHARVPLRISFAPVGGKPRGLTRHLRLVRLGSA